MTRRSGFVLAAAAAALLALAGCGGGDSGAGGAAAAGGNDAGFTAYRDCLGKQGITLPSAPAGGFAGRPSGRPSGRPTTFPSGRPTAFPSRRGPGGGASARPGGFGGFGGMRPQGVDEQQWQKAQTACASVMPTGGPGQGNRRGGGNRGGADTAYRNCLADHGVTPGTTPSAEAEQTCAVLRPTPAPTPTA